MTKPSSANPDWVIRGKTIKQLIQELQSFEDQNLEVKISVDDGETCKPISLVGKKNENGVSFCCLRNCEIAI